MPELEKAKILEKLIKDNGYTIRAFAKKCKIPGSTLYTILRNGVGRASVDNIITICRNLGIKVEDLDDMATGIQQKEEFLPSYDDMEQLLARNGNKLSTEEKFQLIKLLSELK